MLMCQLVIDGERYTVDNMHTVPRELHPRQFSEKKSDTHLMFGGIHSVYNPLPNWYPFKVKFNDNEIDSSEQAYQWAKADYLITVRTAQQLRSCCTQHHLARPKILD